MQINEKIRALREDNDITQDQLAKIAGVSTKQIRRWEQGDSEMGIQKLKLICEYLKVSADYILGLDPNLNWPREERRKRRYTNDCTKYIFLYVKYKIKAGLQGPALIFQKDIDKYTQLLYTTAKEVLLHAYRKF